MTMTLRYPLQLDGVGRPITTTDPGEFWTDRARVLLATIIGERPGDLFYGSDVASAAFMPVDLIESSVTTAVQSAFTRYMGNIDLHDIMLDLSQSETGIVQITVLFSIPEGNTVEVSSVVDLTTIGLG